MKKILLVDDERDILDFLSYNLENAGYKVRVAQNGLEGVKAAQEFLPDLILLDMMMPQMDGIQTCEEIRNLDTEKEIVVAFLTARGEDYSQIAGFEAGADDYILKPIKPKVLMSRVKALLKRTVKTYNSEETGNVDTCSPTVSAIGNSLPKKGNSIDPSAYGPITIPAISSPKTDDWPMRSNNSPKILATSKIIAIWRVNSIKI